MSKKNKLLDNKQFLRIFSAVIAVFCWLLVATTDPASKTVPRTIKDVPVNFELQAGAVSKLGFNIIQSRPQYVDVEVIGNRTTIGQITPKDLATTVKISNITEPGTYELPLVYAGTSNAEAFTVKGYSPKTILVRFDRIAPKTFPIKRVDTGVAAAPVEGFLLGKEYVNPANVTVTGPQADIDKVKECIVRLDLSNPLDKTYSKMSPIILLDAKGEEILPENNNLTLDRTEAEIVVPVLSKIGLPLSIGFLNIPKGFPIWELEECMSVSPNYIELAVPTDTLSNVSEIQLGYIDVRELQIDSNSYNFDIVLPTPSDQIVRVDNVARSEVTFDDSQWSKKTLHIKDIRLLNKPAKYNIALASTTIYDVEFVGDKSLIDALSPDDIVAEIDLSERVLSPGSFELVAELSAPTSGFVWATGVHSVVVHVTEK